MLHSMTAFATDSFVITSPEGRSCTVTLVARSVNSRYMEVTCKLAHALIPLENNLVKILKDTIKRGSVTIIIQLSNPSLFKGRITPDLSLAQSFVAAAQKISQELSLSGSLTINDLVNQPSLFYSEEKGLDQVLEEQILDATKNLVKNLYASGAAEGTSLYNDIWQRAQNLKKLFEAIEARSHDVAHEKKDLITQKLTQLGHQTNMQDPQAAEQQRSTLYYELDRIDIHEEIVRGQSHIISFIKYLDAQGQEKGKRLDFILQELNREINTIAAKCSDYQISSWAIEAKVEIEKAREQVQNCI